MATRKKKIRKYGTNFYETYAKITLEKVVGSEYATLVNVDRPDLQAPDHSIGIEVTRAMEPDKEVAQSMLKGVSGLAAREDDVEYIEILEESGYGFAYKGQGYIGEKDRAYWSLALPLTRIVESKVAKVGSGLYGSYGRMGLYVFCMDPLSQESAVLTCGYVLGLQKYQQARYNTLFLSDIANLYVCDLADGVSIGGRVVQYPISKDRRRAFYLEAIRSQLEQ